MLGIDHTREKARAFMGTSNRWSCPACTLIRFGKATQHLVQYETMAVVHRDKPVTDLIERAVDLGHGYMVVHLTNGVRLFISTPEVLPEGEVRKAEDMLNWVLDLALYHTITRLSIGGAWQYEPETTEQSVCYARVETMGQAYEILRACGFIPIGKGWFDIGMYRPDDAYERLLMTVDEYADDP